MSVLDSINFLVEDFYNDIKDVITTPYVNTFTDEEMRQILESTNPLNLAQRIMWQKFAVEKYFPDRGYDLTAELLGQSVDVGPKKLVYYGNSIVVNGSWELSIYLSDTFHFTQIKNPLAQETKSAMLGWAGNDVALLSQKLGAISPVEIEILISGEWEGDGFK